jgi:hypothetical protein
MVDVDMWLRVFAGGTHPVISGHYRFRTKRVYLPRGAAQVKKSSTNERVKLATLEPAALLRTLALISDIMCAAQYSLPNAMRVANGRVALPPICTQR